LGRQRTTKLGALGRWRRRERGARAAKQEGDPGALEREGDPRGGLQSEAYRLADPRDLVEEEGVVMAAPGGAPQEGKTVEQRRREQRPKHPGGAQDSDLGPRPYDHRLQAPPVGSPSPGTGARTRGGFPVRPMDAVLLVVGGMLCLLRWGRR
jgi:hypothetical protein